MSTYRYPYSITCDEAGFFYLVKFSDLPGAATDGKTRVEALAEAEDRRRKVIRPRGTWALIVSGEPYDEKKAFAITEASPARRLKNLQHQAKALNMTLVPVP